MSIYKSILTPAILLLALSALPACTQLSPEDRALISEAHSDAKAAKEQSIVAADEARLAREDADKAAYAAQAASEKADRIFRAGQNK